MSNTARIGVTDSLKHIIEQHNVTDKMKEEVFLGIKHTEKEYKRQKGLHPGYVVANAFNEQIQEKVDHFVKTNPNGQKITCTKGCSMCCHINVDITEDEASLLYEVMKSDKVQPNYERMEKQISMPVEELKYADRACMFLGEDDACKVYEYRPSACRKYMVVTEPALCHPVTNKHGKVGRAVDIDSEIIGSGILNANKTGSLPKLLKQLIDEEKSRKV